MAADSAAKVGATVHRGGTYVNMEGPQFSTLAESNLYRSWGMDVIGMTNLTEAKLAREAEICYATLALVTDYDCWHPGHDEGDGRPHYRQPAAERRHGAEDDRRHRGARERRTELRLQGRARDRHHHAGVARSGADEAGTGADHRKVPEMKIVVTGSIAYDYLMSFPGKFTDHFLPEHMKRVSLSFLVDSMDKRRGGCAPNIAYTLALLGERPFMMATAGQDFGEYRQWLDAAGVDCSLVTQIDGKFCASFFCSTDVENNQIASFYTGRHGRRRAAVVSRRARLRTGDRCTQRSGRDGAVRRGVPHARHPLHLRSRPAVCAHVGRRTARRRHRRDDRHRQRLRAGAVAHEDRSRRERDPRDRGNLDRHAWRGGIVGHHARRPDRCPVGQGRMRSSIRPASAMLIGVA